MGFMGYIDSLLVGLWFISIFFTTCVRDMSGIVIIISVAIVAIISIAMSTVASLLIASANAAISSVAYPIVFIIILATSKSTSATLSVESAPTMPYYSWKVAISYAINLLTDLVAEATPNIIRYVEDIRDMITSNVAADRDW